MTWSPCRVAVTLGGRGVVAWGRGGGAVDLGACRGGRCDGHVRPRAPRVVRGLVLEEGRAAAARQGHEVHTPTLTGLGERAHLATPEVGLSTHIADVVNVLTLRGPRRRAAGGEQLGAATSSPASPTGCPSGSPSSSTSTPSCRPTARASSTCCPPTVARRWRRSCRPRVTAGCGRASPSRPGRRSPARRGRSSTRPTWPGCSRLCPTPFGHFTEPTPVRDDADMPPRVYIRTRGPTRASTVPRGCSPGGRS